MTVRLRAATSGERHSVVDGLAMFEGDICLGTVEEMERGAGLVQSAAAGEPEIIAHGVVISGDQYRWPHALMPYVIDPGLPNQSRVTDAIAHWESRSNMRFVQRTAANPAQYPNFVRFFKGDGCWSQVGMRGGQQDISLADGCGLGATIHEIGHAWGLWAGQAGEQHDAVEVEQD